MMRWRFTSAEKLWLRLIVLAMLAVIAGQLFSDPATARLLRYANGVGALAILILLVSSRRRHNAEEAN